MRELSNVSETFARKHIAVKHIGSDWLIQPLVVLYGAVADCDSRVALNSYHVYDLR